VKEMRTLISQFFVSLFVNKSLADGVFPSVLGVAIPDLNFQSRDSGLSNSQSRDPGIPSGLA